MDLSKYWRRDLNTYVRMQLGALDIILILLGGGIAILGVRNISSPGWALASLIAVVGILLLSAGLILFRQKFKK